MEEEWKRGRACYFPRNLSVGCSGADVYCLQQFLKHAGYLRASPTGYFEERTETALARWQRDRIAKLRQGSELGQFGESERAEYARLHGMPEPGRTAGPEGVCCVKGKRVGEKFCVDVFASAEGEQASRQRCVPKQEETGHACFEACQMAFGDVCSLVRPSLTGASLFQGTDNPSPHCVTLTGLPCRGQGGP